MRLLLILPREEPEEIKPPSECPYADWGGTRFQFLQKVSKPLRDTEYAQVVAHRYQCLRCFRTHRVYPKEVSTSRIVAQGPLCVSILPESNDGRMRCRWDVFLHLAWLTVLKMRTPCWFLYEVTPGRPERCPKEAAC